MTPLPSKTRLLPAASLLVITLFVTACGSVNDPVTALRDLNWAKVPLAADDVLIVTLSREGEESFSREVRIQDNGSITLPLIGSVTVAGMTCEQAAVQIKRAFTPDERPEKPIKVRVTVPLLLPLISGEIRNPGRIWFMGEITVTWMIQRAGGFTSNANQRKVKLTHADGTAEVVNCIKAASDATYDRKVTMGDFIEVPRK